ncbi:threonine/homoserine/homoserine lactone efflux protein [Volucribacter psittacicida]|uniref:Threonine/homoserine/homoserine lactone efflux protein n=1 Tax=Volucribacter psittacicida TaxID=203482 RepID=A0A4R1G140_9PAST|nr:LysE family translocator [Volucribacter psittacicida]TCJ98708.1 threonine/homoserine/homoserine lactone efflux protein [Volucribacter psittacicida]
MSEKMLFAYWLLSLSITIIPGADWAYIMSAGVKHRISPALSGMLLGYCTIILAVAAGVGALMASKPNLLLGLTIIGALYLFWLGINAFRQPHTINEQNENHLTLWTTWCLKGIAVSGLNPKVLLTFLALLPQFVNPHSDWSATTQILLLGLLHITNCALIYPLVGMGTGALLRQKPQLTCWVNRFSGLAMISVALGLFGQFV